jgi:CHASE3 domain sensor protein
MNFREKTTAVFGIALVIFLTIAFLSYRNARRNDEDSACVLQAHQL